MCVWVVRWDRIEGRGGIDAEEKERLKMIEGRRTGSSELGGRLAVIEDIDFMSFFLLLSFSDLFEDHVLLLSRLGRHEVALAIYAHVLKEPKMAEE